MTHELTEPDRLFLRELLERGPLSAAQYRALGFHATHGPNLHALERAGLFERGPSAVEGWRITDDGEFWLAVADKAARELAALRVQRADLHRQCEALRARVSKLEAQVPPERPAQLFGLGCVRFCRGELWLLNGREKGFARSGFLLASWDELFRRFNVRVTDHGTDEHGPWWAVEPIGAPPR